MKLLFKKNMNGYTLIETMIAVSIFLIIVTIGIGSLLNSLDVNNKSKDLRSIMDNLNFSMEDMSRNIRVGYNYHCGDELSIDTPLSCPPGGPAILFFEEATNGDPNTTADQWGYKISSTNGQPYILEKTTNGGADWQPLNSTEIQIDSYAGFSVLGAEAPINPPSGDTQQPFVTIKLSGKILYKNSETPFAMQTSVSQRLIDIVK